MTQPETLSPSRSFLRIIQHGHALISNKAFQQHFLLCGVYRMTRGVQVFEVKNWQTCQDKLKKCIRFRKAVKSILYVTASNYADNVTAQFILLI